MDTYSITREFADTWALVALVLLFLGVVIWVMRPGASAGYRDSAEIPLRNDEAAPEDGAAPETAKREAQK